jgi:hypothetical protein
VFDLEDNEDILEVLDEIQDEWFQEFNDGDINWDEYNIQYDEMVNPTTAFNPTKKQVLNKMVDLFTKILIRVDSDKLYQITERHNYLIDEYNKNEFNNEKNPLGLYEMAMRSIVDQNNGDIEYREEDLVESN